MSFVLQPAQKFVKPMKILSYGPTYSGKTLGSLYLALGIVMKIRNCSEQDAYKHIVLVDTERGRGALYNKLGEYNYHEIKPPYNTEKLITLLNEINVIDQVDVIIIDSLTHFWVKEGGILEQKAAKDKQGGNGYTNWLEFTAKFNKMIDAILASPKHILTTARAKTDTALVENEKGKKVPVTYGLKPELRDNIEYDFDIAFNIDKISHNLIMEKGIPGIDPVYELATPEIGTKLLDLFTANSVVPVRTDDDIMNSIRVMSKNNNQIVFIQLKLSGRKLDTLTSEELLHLENELITEVKKQQANK